jgi:hypothetical protein
VSERRLLMVTWYDAVSDHAGWKDIAKIEKQTPPVVRSVGWEIKRNKRHVTLAASIVETDCDGDVTIPMGMIIKEQELMVKK